MKNYLLIFLAVTTLAGGVLAWNQYQELIKLRAAALDDGSRSALQKRLWDLEKRKRELEAEVADLRSHKLPAGKAAGQPTAENPSAEFARARRFNRRGAFASLIDNPQFNKLWTVQQKAALDSRYSSLFKALNLSPATLDKFKSLLVEKQSAMMDVMSAAREQGLSPRDPADRTQINSLVQSAEAQIDDTIQQTLGSDAFAQYQNYEQTLPQRNVVNQLAQSLSYTSTPLQDDQVEQLIRILAANAPAGETNSPGMFVAVGGGPAAAMGGMFAGRGAQITESDLAQAQTVLSPPQISALQQLQAQQQAQEQMMSLLRQTFRNGGSPATTK